MYPGLVIVCALSVTLAVYLFRRARRLKRKPGAAPWLLLTLACALVLAVALPALRT